MNKEALAAQLKRHEGVRTKPYKDTVGKLTVGVGRNIDDVPFSADEIELMLSNDIAKAEREARKYVWYDSLSPMRQNVIVNLIFNMGPARFLGFKQFHKAMADSRWEDAAHELDNSKWQEQVDPILGDGKGRADELIAQLKAG